MASGDIPDVPEGVAKIDVGDWVEIHGHLFRLNELTLALNEPPYVSFKSYIEFVEENKDG